LELPTELLKVVSQLNAGDLAKETAKLLALELFREDRVLMGRAAELCYTPLEEFMELRLSIESRFTYGIIELEEDRRTLASLR
jgi:predicted HTH domain antitoxin